ncbi:MAG: PASTA domain-containing protein, partial [Acidobacteriota bacterium]|nr:PASTA domain-containing protein [Acidobacteriota bacterium]
LAAKFSFDPALRAPGRPSATSIHPERRSLLETEPGPALPVAKGSKDDTHREGATIIVSAEPAVTVPDFTRLDESSVAGKCQVLGLRLTLSGSGLAVSQTPLPGVRVPEGSSIEVAFSR